MAKANLHILKCPTGVYMFVGNVPFVLAYDADRITADEVRACMSDSIARQIAARRGGFLRSRTWPTAEAAEAAAIAAGFTVNGGCI